MYVSNVNDRYTIYLGGKKITKNNYIRRTNEIFVHDSKKKEIFSAVVLSWDQKDCCWHYNPMRKLMYQAIVLGDAKLWINAFVRDCYKKKEFGYVQELPQYMMRLISGWISVGMLYLLATNGDHWEISLQKILTKVVDC